MREVMRDVIKTARDKYVMIDTRYTSDHGWETMVFSCNRCGHVYENAWRNPLDEKLYPSIEEANAGHNEIVRKWRFQ